MVPTCSFYNKHIVLCSNMMTSSNGNILRATGPLCGEFTGPGEFPTQRPVTRNFDVFFDLRLNKRLNKQPWGCWFETPSWSLWRHCNEANWIDGFIRFNVISIFANSMWCIYALNDSHYDPLNTITNYVIKTVAPRVNLKRVSNIVYELIIQIRWIFVLILYKNHSIRFLYLSQ